MSYVNRSAFKLNNYRKNIRIDVPVEIAASGDVRAIFAVGEAAELSSEGIDREPPDEMESSGIPTRQYGSLIIYLFRKRIS